MGNIEDSTFENDEIKRIKINKLLQKIISGIFFGASILFLIIYLALPFSRSTSIKVLTDIKGKNTIANKSDGKSVILSDQTILEGMGLKGNEYNAFIDCSKALESFKNAAYVCGYFEPVIKSGPFSLTVSFIDLFPIVSVNGVNYLNDGTMYPSNKENLSNKDQWILDNYDVADKKLVPFLDDETYGNDLTKSIPNLFYVWSFLEFDNLKGVRYDALDNSYYFYWINSYLLQLRIKVSTNLLYEFGHNEYENGINSITNKSLDKLSPTNDEYVTKIDSSLTSEWYDLEFLLDSSSGLYHINEER